ncbi:MAG: bifunctional homocysteine S-methyltransferase/methylenetetrahydrofolate reductase [Desulfuromonadales bacterium]|nr:bifunctional homocysteine S-methyltransferase/methylenetetrahydrofolate reductase [Desulfuromonadales bacterium]
MSEQQRQKLRQRLQHGPVIIGDGGMGSQLYQCGAPLDAVFEYLNLIDAKLVNRVHAEYVAAGAELIETNTFGANRLRLESFGLAHKTEEINCAGARLARQAAGDERWVSGSVGPIARQSEQDAELDDALLTELFRQQMQALVDGGVDCFSLETFSRVSDLEIALKVAKELDRPALAQLAYSEGGFSGDGLNVEEVAARLSQLNPAAIGANCGAGPRELLKILRRLAAATELPLSVFPNSGFPEYVNGRHIYLATPDYFAALGQEMVAAGVSLIGGCCGAGPEHITALAAAVAGTAPGLRPTPGSRPTKVESRQQATPAPSTPSETAPKTSSNFLSDWGKRPIITVELDPPKGLDVAPIMAQAQQLSAAGVDAINLAENPLARIRMGNLALAAKMQQQTGTEVIAHVTARDRNLIGLHSELMGAHLLGLRTLLAVTGDPVAVSGEAGASSVFDVNSVGLLELLNAMNQGRTLYGADINGQTEFLLGAAFNPNPKNLSGQLRKLEKKLKAGARFVQTQPIYDVATLQRMVAAVQPFDAPVLVGIMPLVSERNAEFLHNEVPGIQLPEAVRRQMAGKSGEEGRATGLKLALEVVEAGRAAGVGGYYLIPPFGKVELALKLIEAIRLEA